MTEQSGRQHERLVHDRCDLDSCNICELYICRVCNCAEGTLPTHCPGELVFGIAQDAIYAKKLDYLNGEWYWIGEPVEIYEVPGVSPVAGAKDDE